MDQQQDQPVQHSVNPSLRVDLQGSRVHVAFWVLSMVLGAAQAWTSRFAMVNDTISYLEMGDYFFHGHPAAIINGIWSPLYALLLGGTLAIFKPSPYAEYPVIHLLLFLIFLFTLASFEFFLRQMVRLRGRSSPERSASHSDWPWIAIAYIIFLWSALDLIGVSETNPDMLVAAFFYLSCGLLAKISTGQVSWRTLLGFGVILGLSYLTKAVMFPLSLVLLATAWRAAKQKSRYVLVSLAAFVMIAAPFAGALSAQKGRITLGESGRYNYAVHVNRIPLHHWQGDTHTGEAPVHPTREIFLFPATFEFKGPVPGTYPVWYDPTYWYEGVKPHVHVREQIIVVFKNLFHEFQTVFYGFNGIFLTTLLLTFYEARNKLSILENMFRCWFLIMPSALGVGLYALVHYETRYVGPFFVVIGVCLFSSILWADDCPNRRLFSGVAILQLLMLLWTFAVDIRHLGSSEKGAYQSIAESATKMGLRPGDQIASLNFSNLGTAMWAHLARVQIIAEVYYWPGGPEGAANCFWNADAATQEKLLRRLSQTGAKAVVSSDAPAGPGASRWSRIGDTGSYLLWLNSATLAPQGTVQDDGGLN